jgi:hypothetical protein
MTIGLIWVGVWCVYVVGDAVLSRVMGNPADKGV